MDVLVVSDGVLALPTSTMATNVDPADLAIWLDDNFLPRDAFDWPLNVMVVRSGGQTILVDAGLGAQFPGFPRAGQFPRRLEAAGIGLESVTTPKDAVTTGRRISPAHLFGRKQLVPQAKEYGLVNEILPVADTYQTRADRRDKRKPTNTSPASSIA
jgi:hypothetical protein